MVSSITYPEFWKCGIRCGGWAPLSMWMSLHSEMNSYPQRYSIVTYPAIWRCDHISRGRCGCECGGCASLKEMIHLQWETTASPVGDLLACPNFGICDTTRRQLSFFYRVSFGIMRLSSIFIL
jgi:hypothetical protein